MSDDHRELEQVVRLVSWPMYPADPAAIGTFWQRLREAMRDAGLRDIAPFLSAPDDLSAHWRDPTLLLSQTCGYPFVTSLAGTVRYVATPCFNAPGCEGGAYRSAIVVRRNQAAATIADMAGHRVAFNSRDSQSGYNCLRGFVAPHARNGRFFGGTLETGAHRRSIEAVTSGLADLAAIDVVTLALVGDQTPDTIADLRVLCHTPSTPGLPLVTAGTTSDADLARLRHAVEDAFRGDTSTTQAMRLDGVIRLPDNAYRDLLAMRDRAVALGYPELG